MRRRVRGLGLGEPDASPPRDLALASHGLSKTFRARGAPGGGNSEIRAVEALSATPLQKVEHLVALGEWLYCSGYPLADAEDQLMAAIDLLMDCEEVPDDDGDDGGASTVMSQSDLASVAGGSDAGPAPRDRSHAGPRPGAPDRLRRACPRS